MITTQRKHERKDIQFDTDALELCRDTFRLASHHSLRLLPRARQLSLPIPPSLHDGDRD